MDDTNITHIGKQELSYRFKELVGKKTASLPLNDMYNEVLGKYNATLENAREAAEMGNREKMETELNDLKIYHLMMEKAANIGSLWGVYRRVVCLLPEYKEFRKRKEVREIIKSRERFIPPFGEQAADQIKDGER